MKDIPMSLATTNPVSSALAAFTAPSVSRIATHPGSGRAVFATTADTWDNIFAFADIHGLADATMDVILGEWLKCRLH